VKRLALLGLLLPLTGCVSVGKLVAELKNDPATVSVSITTIYGTVKFVRIGFLTATNGSASVMPDGSVILKGQ
jgi:hypothetical protein